MSSRAAYIDLPRVSQLPEVDIDEHEVQPQAESIAREFVAAFDAACSRQDHSAFDELFIEEQGWWRDIIAFTNDYRCIRSPNIRQAAKDRLAVVSASGAQLRTTPSPAIVRPFPKARYAFLEAHFDFATATGPAFGLARLVPDPQGRWRAFTLFTLLEGVHGHPERIGDKRPRGVHNTAQPWHVERSNFANFDGHDPDVLIVGAGHNGLELGARLGAVGLNTLIVDKQKRVGDNWRLRYESLSLHDPCYANHLSFMPFPSNWPVFTPAGKLASWLEAYVDAQDLNVWCMSAILPEETHFDEDAKLWRVTVSRAGTKRHLSVKHVVLATGMSGGFPRLPAPFPGQESYTGRLVHSSQHGSGRNWTGKRALVVGACTSAHDISLDLVNYGCDVTMLQRSPTFIMTVKNGVEIFHSPLYSENAPPTDIADRKLESMPKHVLFLHHKHHLVPQVQERDRELLDGLRQAGFALTVGPDGTGWQQLALEKAGGYYFDTGASSKIVDGFIKVRSGEIASFAGGNKVVFKDGMSDDFDTIIFATGYTGFDDTVRRTLGDKYASMMESVFGLDSEGETRAVARESGIPQMYWMVGHFALARILSKVIATQILAEQLGTFGPRYTIDAQRST